jgi:putative transposase
MCVTPSTFHNGHLGPEKQEVRHTMGGYVYHVLNRAVGRATHFAKVTDYEAFVRVLSEALDWVDIRLLAYCVMPNHWHLVVWPERDGDLSEFMRWLTLTHTQRWHAKHHTQGTDPLLRPSRSRVALLVRDGREKGS